jgi:hypothetical protein
VRTVPGTALRCINDRYWLVTTLDLIIFLKLRIKINVSEDFSIFPVNRF